ncbi:MAG: Murein hydrolase activator NlpD [uncultured Caballeronia sp.]|nr:MAG: Murein hydrolase activator NlpD [uncultured Caballeronia sp.]
MSKVARANRTPVQNIVRWNNLSDPNAIEVGQVLRVAPPPCSVIRGFDGKNSKGIDIAGASGTQIVAAAAGTVVTVVYAGNGLRGYGNLLIVKHNAAYAHNCALLAKEGQSVTQGQTIAEMGDTDTNRVMLHFELRYKGSLIDPSRYLPAR